MKTHPKIYLDYAAATPIDPRAERVVLKYMKIFGNPSSLHEAGQQAREVLEDSRKRVARVLNCRPEEVVFTGSGTESANLAVFGVARAFTPHLSLGRVLRSFVAGMPKKGAGSTTKLGKGNIITTRIEHHAVLRACQYLEEHEGFKVTYLDVRPNGIVDPESVRKALRPDTILVSIMCANNEIGTIQPIAAISKILKDFRNSRRLQVAGYRLQAYEKAPLFHTDACQAAGALNLNVNQLGVDLMTLNSSKIYGPKGVGCLYIKRGTPLAPIIVGGSQERGLRAGTENVPAIAGFAEALEIADAAKEKEGKRLAKLRDYLINQILKKIPGSRLNGDQVLRLPNNINISFEGVDGEMLVLALDQKSIQVSTGAACTTTEMGSTEASTELSRMSSPQAGLSHVLSALQGPASYEAGPHPNLRSDLEFQGPTLGTGSIYHFGGSIRITLGRQTTKKDVDHVVKILPAVIKRLRKSF